MRLAAAASHVHVLALGWSACNGTTHTAIRYSLALAFISSPPVNQALMRCSRDGGGDIWDCWEPSLAEGFVPGAPRAMPTPRGASEAPDGTNDAAEGTSELLEGASELPAPAAGAWLRSELCSSCLSATSRIDPGAGWNSGVLSAAACNRDLLHRGGDVLGRRHKNLVMGREMAPVPACLPHMDTRMVAVRLLRWHSEKPRRKHDLSRSSTHFAHTHHAWALTDRPAVPFRSNNNDSIPRSIPQDFCDASATVPAAGGACVLAGCAGRTCVHSSHFYRCLHQAEAYRRSFWTSVRGIAGGASRHIRPPPDQGIWSW